MRAFVLKQLLNIVSVVLSCSTDASREIIQGYLNSLHVARQRTHRSAATKKAILIIAHIIYISSKKI